MVRPRMKRQAVDVLREERGLGVTRACVGSETPYLRHRSLVFAPASASLNTPMICSSVYRFAFSRSLSAHGLYWFLDQMQRSGRADAGLLWTGLTTMPDMRRCQVEDIKQRYQLRRYTRAVA